jgi:hypothetical protein
LLLPRWLYAEFVPGLQHRNTLGKQQRGQQVALTATRSLMAGIVRGPSTP